ncbi:MAG: hypothetical protein K1X83_13060 [Oligoflexia bacterium]|nr:hypothetical protein [Oligoflexia bacterium]
MNRAPIKLLLFWLLALPCWAEERVVKVLVDAAFEPTQSVGLVISKNSSTQKLKTSLDRIAEHLWSVSFKVSPADLSADHFASALVLSNAGEMAFGEVISLDTQSASSSFVSLPTCPGDSIDISKVANQFALVESLVGVRSERAKVLKEAITTELDEPTLLRFKKLEEGFGLERSAALSAELASTDLLDRLLRIKAAIDNLEYEKAQRDRKTTVAAAVESPTPEPVPSPTPSLVN